MQSCDEWGNASQTLNVLLSNSVAGSLKQSMLPCCHGHCTFYHQNGFGECSNFDPIATKCVCTTPTARKVPRGLKHNCLWQARKEKHAAALKGLDVCERGCFLTNSCGLHLVLCCGCKHHSKSLWIASWQPSGVHLFSLRGRLLCMPEMHCKCVDREFSTLLWSPVEIVERLL
jgi:hypothetical protein